MVNTLLHISLSSNHKDTDQARLLRFLAPEEQFGALQKGRGRGGLLELHLNASSRFWPQRRPRATGHRFSIPGLLAPLIVPYYRRRPFCICRQRCSFVRIVSTMLPGYGPGCL